MATHPAADRPGDRSSPSMCGGLQPLFAVESNQFREFVFLGQLFLLKPFFLKLFSRRQHMAFLQFIQIAV
jgi:hypothetical protein